MSSINNPPPGVQPVRGSCHCGAVRFEAHIDLATGFRCNCSACTKFASFVATAEPETFRFIAGEADLTEYRFGAEKLRRFFCRRCSVLCFAKSDAAKLGQEDVNVNLNTLDGIELSTLPVVYFDGRHDKFDPAPTPWPMFPPAQASAR
jgi:hypothetical protein